MRNSFILYSSYEEILKELSKEEIGELLMAIFAYQRIGEKPELSRGANIAFLFIKNQLDIDAEKWEKEVANRSKAGKKGMEKRWGKKSAEDDNNDITKDNSVISVISKITDNEDVYEDEYANVYENENKNVNEKKRNPLLTFSEELNRKIEEWIVYKNLPPMGVISLINYIKEQLNKYSEKEIISLIDLCIIRGWKNIIWERLDKNNKQKEFCDNFSMK